MPSTPKAGFKASNARCQSAFSLSVSGSWSWMPLLGDSLLNTRRESGMLFKENGSKCRRGDLGNIIFLFVISDVAGKLK